MQDDNTKFEDTVPETERSQEPEVKELFVEDLEVRRNASGPVTSLSLGEEDGGGW
jgi:hypothetical protein